MRFAYLDALRGMAVVWMIIFHFSYDLKMFHYLNWDFTHGFWFAFPRVIAFTFLFCVGISLHLTHQGKIKWSSLKKRSLKLALSALAVSLGTYVMFPSQWIFFGTLHCIFVGSIFGALLVNHRKLSVILLFVILILQYGLHFDIKWVSSIVQKSSLDFIPVYPWFWAILSGIVLAPYLSRMSFLNRVKPNKFLNFLGQHSLKIYLLHQPVLFGLIWAYTNLVVR
jgi:uncharacterized membrane protein